MNIFLKLTFLPTLRRFPVFAKSLHLGVYPPPPPPLKGLTGTASAKVACKILSHKGLRVKSLRTKELSRFPRPRLTPPPPRQYSALQNSRSRLGVTRGGGKP